MASRFASISHEEVKEFTEKLENENTKKTLYEIKVFKEYLDACDEEREIEDITPVELREIIKKKFVLAVRKKNGEEYEPSSLRAFIHKSTDRHLRKNNYGFSVLNDKEFHEVQDILKKKQKQPKSIGKGNRPNAADPLSDEDIDTFYSRKVPGIHSPRVLLNTETRTWSHVVQLLSAWSQFLEKHAQEHDKRFGPRNRLDYQPLFWKEPALLPFRGGTTRESDGNRA